MVNGEGLSVAREDAKAQKGGTAIGGTIKVRGAAVFGSLRGFSKP